MMVNDIGCPKFCWDGGSLNYIYLAIGDHHFTFEISIETSVPGPRSQSLTFLFSPSSGLWSPVPAIGFYRIPGPRSQLVTLHKLFKEKKKYLYCEMSQMTEINNENFFVKN